MNKNLVPKYAKWTVDKKLICTLCGTIVKNVTMWSMKHAKSEEHLLKVKENKEKEKEKNSEVKKEERQIDKNETNKIKQENEDEKKKTMIRDILLQSLDNEEDIDDNNFVLPSNFFDAPSHNQINQQPSNPNKKSNLVKKVNNNDNDNQTKVVKNKDIEINEEKEINNDNSSEIEDEVESMIKCAEKVNKIISQYTKKQNKPTNKEIKAILSKKSPPPSELPETKEELLSQILND